MTTTTDDKDWKDPRQATATAEPAEGDVEIILEDDNTDDGATTVVEDTKPAPKPGRAEERIRQLVREKKETERRANEALSAAQQEIADLKRGRITDNRRAAETQATQIETVLEAKKKALKAAKNEGDLDLEIALTEEISDLVVQRRVMAASKDKFVQEETEVAKPTPKPTSTATTKVDRSELPEAMQDWLAENTWFDEDPVLQAAALASANQLLAEGYDQSTPEFFEKIDEKMSRFGAKGSDGVQLKNKPSPSATSDVKPRQTVPGASRTPTSKKGRVILTREEAALADRLGVPRERYAARKKAQEEAGNGWVEIKRT